MKDKFFPSPTAVICIGVHGLSSNPASLTAGAAPHHCFAPRFDNVNHPLSDSFTVSAAGYTSTVLLAVYASEIKVHYSRRPFDRLTVHVAYTIGGSERNSHTRTAWLLSMAVPIS